MFSVTQAYLKTNTSLALMRFKNWVIKGRKKPENNCIYPGASLMTEFSWKILSLPRFNPSGV